MFLYYPPRLVRHVNVLLFTASLWIATLGSLTLEDTCRSVAFVDVPDSGLLEAVRESIRRELSLDVAVGQDGSDTAATVPCELLARLTNIEAASPAQTVRSLNGLEYAISLEVLTLRMIPVPRCQRTSYSRA